MWYRKNIHHLPLQPARGINEVFGFLGDIGNSRLIWGEEEGDRERRRCGYLYLISGVSTKSWPPAINVGRGCEGEMSQMTDVWHCEKEIKHVRGCEGEMSQMTDVWRCEKEIKHVRGCDGEMTDVSGVRQNEDNI